MFQKDYIVLSQKMPLPLKSNQTVVACIEDLECSAELIGNSNQNEQGRGYALTAMNSETRENSEICDMSNDINCNF